MKFPQVYTVEVRHVKNFDSKYFEGYTQLDIKLSKIVRGGAEFLKDYIGNEKINWIKILDKTGEGHDVGCDYLNSPPEFFLNELYFFQKSTKFNKIIGSRFADDSFDLSCYFDKNMPEKEKEDRYKVF